MLNRTAYFVSTGHVQDHFNRQTIDTKCTHTVQVRMAIAMRTCHAHLVMCCGRRTCHSMACLQRGLRQSQVNKPDDMGGSSETTT